jgi:mannitol/fructose-specific phosphotransferase system IIA component (Ntr-type)
MNLARLLKPQLIKLELETEPPPPSDPPLSPERTVWIIKEGVLAELTGMIAAGSRIGNQKRLYTDLVNRERKASTGLAGGIAIPHVRTMEVRELVFGFARSTPGLEFDTIDGEPAHLFFVLVAPPYDDVNYLRIYKQMATAFHTTDVRQAFLRAKDEGEVIRAARLMGD